MQVQAFAQVPCYNPLEVRRLYNLMELVAGGVLGHGPTHLLVESAGVVGFVWASEVLCWIRLGLPLLSQLAGLYPLEV